MNMQCTHELVYRKSLNREPRLSFAAHLEPGNHNKLIMLSRVTQTTGYAERETAKALLGEIAPRT